MTPQSSFMVVAPLERSRVEEMRRLLATMNVEPGAANPDNELVPFSRFDNIHFARFVVLDDQTTGDIEAVYGMRRPAPPVYLAFLGEIDGSYTDFMRKLVEQAGPGLRRIFSLCGGFSNGTDLHSWMLANEHGPAAFYCNWVGRTVLQARQEQQLRRTLRKYLDERPGLLDSSAQNVHQALRTFVKAEEGAGRITLTPPGPTPLGWKLRHLFDWTALVLLLVVGVVTLPLTLIPLLILAFRLRTLEKSDPTIAPPPSKEWAEGLARLEDHDVTNQFTVIGTLKPGLLRTAIVAVVVRIIDLTARTIYTRGRLGRVHTIHFARWVYLDNHTRMAFTSNYDGSLESYMDDFINKVAFGLNVIFSNGVGYPHTDWLLLKGAKNEQAFKYHLRRHQLPTEVWYNGHAGLTAVDLHRNSLIREGLEQPSPGEEQAREWVALL